MSCRKRTEFFVKVPESCSNKFREWMRLKHCLVVHTETCSSNCRALIRLPAPTRQDNLKHSLQTALGIPYADFELRNPLPTDVFDESIENAVEKMDIETLRKTLLDVMLAFVSIIIGG